MSLSHPRTLISTSVAVALCLAIASNSNALDITPNTTPFPAPVGKRAETSIAIDPNDPDVMLAAAMPGIGIVISWTTDGGSNWTQFVNPDGVTFKFDRTRADPAVAIRKRDGLWIVGCLMEKVVTVTEQNEIVIGSVGILYSANQGEAWQSLVVKAVQSTPDFFVETEFFDKLHLAVDNVDSSPGYGDVFMAWYAVDVEVGGLGSPPVSVFSNPRIQFGRSDWDGGSTNGGISIWAQTTTRLGEDVLASTAFQNVFAPNVAVGVEGEVYVTWSLYEKPPDDINDHPKAMGMVMGLPDVVDEHAPLSWGSGYVAVDQIVAPDSRGSGSGIGNGWGTVLGYPVAVVDRSQTASRGTVHLTWVGKELTADGSYDVRLASSQPGARLEPQFPPASRHSAGLNTDSDQFMHWAACDPSNGALGLIYFDRSADPADTMVTVTFSRSIDGGVTWEDWTLTDPGVQFTDPEGIGAKGREYIGIDGIGGTFAPLWMDARTGGWNVYFSSVTTPLPAIFTNESANQASLAAAFAQADPEDAITVDLDGNAYPDLVVAFGDDEPQQPLGVWLGAQPSGSSEVGMFNPISVDNTLKGARTATASDLTGDLADDLFLPAAATPRLGVAEEVTPGIWQYSDQSNLLPATGLDHATGAAIGDWSGTGKPYIYVTRANDNDGSPAGIEAAGGLVDKILEATYDVNDVLTGFVDKTSSLLPYWNKTSKTKGATWANLDTDSELELFVNWLAPADLTPVNGIGWSIYYDWDRSQGKFVDRTGPASDPTRRFGQFGSVTSSAFADIGGDPLPDLILGRAKVTGLPEANLLIWENDSTTGQLMTEPGRGLNNTEQPTRQVAVADLDQNGISDVYGSPFDNGVPPTALMGYGTSQDAAIYSDTGGTLGLPQRNTRGLALADLNSDNDPDLFLGPPDISSTSEFLWGNVSDDTHTGNCLVVTVQGTHGYAPSGGLGATISVSATGTGGESFEQSFTLDDRNRYGGSLRNSHSFHFSPATAANVVVEWPDGAKVINSAVPLDGTPLTVSYPTPTGVGIQSASITASYIPGTSSMERVFQWKTGQQSKRNEVLIKKQRFGGVCEVVPSGQTELVLTPEMGAVVEYSYLDANGDWVHTIRWQGPLCYAPCTYQYRVRSYTPSSTAVTSQYTSMSVAICGTVQE
jgi:hypothetical protein